MPGGLSASSRRLLRNTGHEGPVVGRQYSVAGHLLRRPATRQRYDGLVRKLERCVCDPLSVHTGTDARVNGVGRSFGHGGWAPREVPGGARALLTGVTKAPPVSRIGCSQGASDVPGNGCRSAWCPCRRTGLPGCCASRPRVRRSSTCAGPRGKNSGSARSLPRPPGAWRAAVGRFERATECLLSVVSDTVGDARDAEVGCGQEVPRQVHPPVCEVTDR
jgi:hypothetical protein